MRAAPILLAVLVSLPIELFAADVVATRVLRVGTVLSAGDLDTKNPDAAPHIDALLGMEVRRAIYLGHKVTQSDVGPPRIIRRNDKVTVLFRSRSIDLRTDARALGAGALGEYIDVLNLDSRLTVTARVVGPGVVEVGR